MKRKEHSVRNSVLDTKYLSVRIHSAMIYRCGGTIWLVGVCFRSRLPSSCGFGYFQLAPSIPCRIANDDRVYEGVCFLFFCLKKHTHKTTCFVASMRSLNFW